ncbi:hypothetical protein [Arthrobacter sedimenti]|uniref:hypothetical protein n=1 Tax=Arthrobacter sedimenti TaxID=2694931 RepID=UPI00142017C4|nr:hypothetical protein [Arthrobacter sedimenti]
MKPGHPYSCLGDGLPIGLGQQGHIGAHTVNNPCEDLHLTLEVRDGVGRGVEAAGLGGIGLQFHASGQDGQQPVPVAFPDPGLGDPGQVQGRLLERSPSRRGSGAQVQVTEMNQVLGVGVVALVTACLPGEDVGDEAVDRRWFARVGEAIFSMVSRREMVVPWAALLIKSR